MLSRPYESTVKQQVVMMVWCDVINLEVLPAPKKPMMAKVVEVHEDVGGSRCRRNDGEQIRSDIGNVHEVVREVVVEIEAQVLHVDEDVTVLEIVGVREGVVEIIEARMMQLCQEVFTMMYKSEFAASGRIGSMKAV